MKWKIHNAADFWSHLNTVDSLGTQGNTTPLLCSTFLTSLLREFGTKGQVLAVCEDATGPLALTILTPKGYGVWETFQPSQAPIGVWMQREGTSLDELLKDLLPALPGFAVAVGITQQDPDLFPRPVDGRCISTLDYIRTARITIEGSFEQYWEARGKNLKQNIKKQRNRLEKEGISATLEIIGKRCDIEQAISDYGALESAGWKASGGTAVHPHNSQGRFYRAMLENFCDQHQARVYRYRFNNKIVAIDLCIEKDSTLIILKTTHDESMKGYSPAFLMRQEAFAKLFREGNVKRIEFYGKLMEWHTRWTAEARTMYHINYHRWPALSKFRHCLTGIRHRNSS